MSQSAKSETSDLNRVFLWVIPRTLATVTTKCLSYVDDMQIFYEPFVVAHHYGPESTPKSPGLVNFIEQANATRMDFPLAFDDNECTFSWAKEQLEAEYPGKKYLFVKDTAYCLQERYDMIPAGFQHAFLIRHPYKVFPSWNKVLKRMTGVDLIVPGGKMYEELFNVMKYVQDNLNANPVIIDADDIQNNPSSTLRQFCQAVGIPYSDALLEWPGHREITKTWKASRTSLQGNLLESEGGFYENALKSTGFLPAKPIPERSELTEEIQKAADYSMPFYKKMYDMRLTP